MSKKELGSIPQIARELLDHLPKAMDDELKILIARAEEGQDVSIEVVDLFSKHEITRGWLKEQINLQSREMGVTPEYAPLAGNPKFVPPNQRWVCPKNPHNHWIVVIQEGEPAPWCEEHKIEMVRESKKKG
jgi:hypothetical protein